VKVKQLTVELEAQWTDFVHSQAKACVCHSLAWRNGVMAAYGHRPYYLMAVDESERIQGILPLFRIARPGFGTILVSDPFTSYGGVIAVDGATATGLMDAATALGKRLGARYVEIKSGISWNLPEDGGWAIRTDLCSVEIQLPAKAEDFWNAWGSRNRNHIKRATGKEGLSVCVGHALLDDFYRLIVLDMHRLGTPVHAKRFYRAMLEQYGAAANVWVAYAGGQPAGAVFSLQDAFTVSALAGVRNPGLSQSNAMRLLYWNLIEASCGKVAVLDLGRSARGSGTHAFKVGMGGKERLLTYCYRLIKEREIPLLDQHNPAMQRYIRTWQSLPIGVTRHLGPRLIRYVP
jgi:serine/alanine adding enzyme